MYVAAGVTTIRNMWGIPEHVTWRSEIARGQRFGPTLVTAGSLIDGDPPDWTGSVVLTNPADAEALVVAQKAAGYDFLKVVNHLTREAYEALVAAAKRHDMLVAGHVTNAVGLAGTFAAHQRSIEHLDGYIAALVPPGTSLPSPDDKTWTQVALAKADLARLPKLIEQTLASGAWNCATLIVYGPPPSQRVKWLALIPAATRAHWLHNEKTPPSAEDLATSRANTAMLGKILAALAAAGAPILVGTDTGQDFVLPGEALHDEIELEVAAGVPRPRVLRAATADAWRYLGRDDGTIEVGGRADLILVTSDPLTAPLPLVPDGVMLRGAWLPRSDLEARLAVIAQHAAATPEPYKDGVRYATVLDGTTVTQERVTAGETIHGELTDLVEHTSSSYELGTNTATLEWNYRTMKLALRGVVTANELVVTGTDLWAKPIALRAPLAGGFLSSPGIAGTMRLVAQLADLKPGGKRTLSSLELANDPIAIVASRYAVERKPDRDGHHIYQVAVTRHDATTTMELVVDGAGIVEQRGDEALVRRY
jgi:hypothetical protein